LAAHAKEFQIGVMHPESELAAINMALGAASMGLKTMVASSGGGMALMEEAFSLSGMAEVPVLAVLGSSLVLPQVCLLTQSKETCALP